MKSDEEIRKAIPAEKLLEIYAPARMALKLGDIASHYRAYTTGEIYLSKISSIYGYDYVIDLINTYISSVYVFVGKKPIPAELNEISGAVYRRAYGFKIAELYYFTEGLKVADSLDMKSICGKFIINNLNAYISERSRVLYNIEQRKTQEQMQQNTFSWGAFVFGIRASVSPKERCKYTYEQVMNYVKNEGINPYTNEKITMPNEQQKVKT